MSKLPVGHIVKITTAFPYRVEQYEILKEFDLEEELKSVPNNSSEENLRSLNNILNKLIEEGYITPFNPSKVTH